MPKRPAFLVALFAALILPLALGSDGRAPLALRGLAARDAHAAIEPGKDKNYDLAGLEVFRKSVVTVKDNYVDPNRIDPKEMFVSALEAVEKQVPEVMVEPGGPVCAHTKAAEPGTAAQPACTAANTLNKVPDGKIRVTVGGAVREFDYSEVDNIWKIPLKMREVFSFIKENLVSSTDQREIEYAAVNGMLTTLDPHSWLLKPDQYKEMSVQTKGEFGGLGFVISMREDRLTVMKVLKNTPAFRAGIKKGDVIQQIDNDSVGGMDLSEAVDRMRGKPGSKVTIYLQRKGQELKKLDLSRGIITYETVTSKLLDNGVGYVRLSSFSGTTNDNMKAAIKAMKAANGGTLKGLIMDLRGNPGGLLDQAIKVSDVFVEDGTIVTTVGMNGTLRDPKLAHNDGGEREYPMAVLISSDSASASEIVAGALKNLNRALIVGRQSFGKGSVQLLYDMPDKDAGDSALKLTIAQYLTPGDISIQEVGITPDIELVPARVTKDRIDLFSSPKTFREQDYDKHFFNAFAASEAEAKASRARAGGTPFESLRYFKEETAKEKKARESAEAGTVPDDDDAADADPDDDGVVLDYQIEFCRDLLGRAVSTNRLEQLQQMKPFVAERRSTEQEKVSKALEGLGLDWTAAPAELAAQEKGQKAKVTAELKAPHTSAGATMDLVLTAHNNGTTPLYRVRAATKSDDTLLDRREFVFGKLNPGEKRSWTVPVLVPRYTPSRRDDVEIKLDDDAGMTFDEAKGETDMAELPRPAFAWSWHLGAGSTDGLLRPGSLVELIVDVKNIGSGQALDAYAGLKNLSEDRINVKKGHSKVGPIKPGETRTITFMLEAKKALDADGPVPVRLELGDRLLWDTVHQKIFLPVGPESAAANSGPSVRVTVDSSLLAAAQGTSERVADVKKGTVLTAKGKAGSFYRVEWQKGVLAYLPEAAGKETKEVASAKSSHAAALFPAEAPLIKLENIDTTKGGLEVDTDRMTIAGTASDPQGMRDLQIFVQHETEYRKVFFRTAKKQGELTSAQGPTTIQFSAELPLKPGNNTIFLVAREDDDLQGTRTLVIHRKAPGTQLAQKQEKAAAAAAAH
jgi:carboxyl-terminal processing protease